MNNIYFKYLFPFLDLLGPVICLPGRMMEAAAVMREESFIDVQVGIPPRATLHPAADVLTAVVSQSLFGKL